MGGIKAAAGYAFSVNDTRQRHAQCRNRLCDRQQHARITAALQYARGPLSAFLGYDQLNASRLQRRAATPAPTSSAPHTISPR